MKVYDAEFCGDLGVYGAHCAHTITKTTRDIPKAQWDKTRVGWLCVNSTDFNNTENSLDQLCNDYQCDYQTQQALQTFKSHIHGVIRKAQAAKAMAVRQEQLMSVDPNLVPDAQ